MLGDERHARQLDGLEAFADVRRGGAALKMMTGEAAR